MRLIQLNWPAWRAVGLAAVLAGKGYLSGDRAKVVRRCRALLAAGSLSRAQVGCEIRVAIGGRTRRRRARPRRRPARKVSGQARLFIYGLRASEACDWRRRRRRRRKLAGDGRLACARLRSAALAGERAAGRPTRSSGGPLAGRVTTWPPIGAIGATSDTKAAARAHSGLVSPDSMGSRSPMDGHSLAARRDSSHRARRSKPEAPSCRVETWSGQTSADLLAPPPHLSM